MDGTNWSWARKVILGDRAGKDHRMNAGNGLPKARVLVVEDDRRTAEMMAVYLRHAGHLVSVEHDGAAGLARARAEEFDLLVLDRMLPGTDGVEIVRALRDGDTAPVIFVTARTLEDERLEGFEAGADDYLTKPFDPRELVARVAALLRRTPPGSQDRSRVGALVIDHAAHRGLLDDIPLDLTPSEFAILGALAERPGRVKSRLMLLDALPGEGLETRERTVDVHVANLRRKLLDAGAGERVAIETAFGAGYRLAVDGVT
jgi:DNA-binding response OmpR family regulator